MPKWYPIIGGPWDGDKFYPSSDPQPGEKFLSLIDGAYYWSDNGMSLIWRAM